jgi:hypothetical protein
MNNNNKMNKELEELKSKTVKVTFTRVYEIPVPDVLEHKTDEELELELWNEEKEWCIENIKTEAVRMAEDYFSEEMLDFAENIENFVGAKTEII